MGFFSNFPYTNFHELNLNWLMTEMKNLKSYVEQYTAINNVAYAGVWDITDQYPQWSIVSNGDSSYLASQAVPAGIDITNSEYWVHLADLDPRIGDILNSIGTLETEVDKNSKQIATLETDVTKIKNTKRRFIIVGDSYLEGYNPDGNVTSFGKLFKSYMGLTDSRCYLWYEGGAGFGAVGQKGHTFSSLVAANASNVTSPETITDVWVLGGYNDKTAPENVAQGVADLKSTVTNAFPNAVLAIGAIGRNCSQNNPYQAGLLNVYNQMKQTSVPYLTNIECACRRISFFGSDGYHPNASGQAAIAKSLVEIARIGSTFPYEHFIKTDLTCPYNVTVTGPITILYISGGNLTVPGLAGATLNGSTEHDLGLINDGSFATSALGLPITLTGYVSTTSGWAACTLKLWVDQKRHAKITITCATGSGFAVAKDTATYVVLTSGMIEYPTICC